MEIVYTDKDVVVAVKPAGVLSTDEPGGMPELLRASLNHDNVRSVHRLDRVVSGLMVYALRSKAASELSRQIREDQFRKEYLAVAVGRLPEEGELRHLLIRDARERKTYVVQDMVPGAQEAVLRYQVVERRDNWNLLRIQLLTGRTHQIRCQLAAAGCPLLGDRKYGAEGEGDIALWSCRLAFSQPYSGEKLDFFRKPSGYPWDLFHYITD